MSRRGWFRGMSDGLQGAALASLLGLHRSARGEEASPERHPLQVAREGGLKLPHIRPRAKAVIQLFMPGGPSHLDLLDPKPMLDRYDGKPYPGILDVMVSGNAGGLMRSPFRFTKHGQSGLDVSELLPNIAKHADDLTVVRSMHTEHINHEPAIWMFNTGRITPGNPSTGSWVIYGLGSENQELPAYVVLDDPKGMPLDGIRNWSAGWLPPIYQGTRFRSEGMPVLNLKPKPGASHKARLRQLALIDDLARQHRAGHPGEAELDARIASYELAAKMQTSAIRSLDLASESAATQELYGLNDEVTASYGRRCLMARRLVERGVRFVQVFMEGAIWDHHSGIVPGLRTLCRQTDLPIAGLLRDLKQRGLLDETLVMWAGEFGRLPISESGTGRDHNPRGFTLWLAGGGTKAGYVHGATDDFGYVAVKDPVSVPDLHATVLHLLGLDHKRLVYNVQGLNEGLISTRYTPRVVTELIA
jgi:hypothetical protein